MSVCQRVLAVALSIACSIATLPVFAQSYPTRAITLIVPYPPGAALDQVARLVQPKLNAALGVPIIVENRAGNAGNIGSNAVARAAPDGYTFLLTAGAVVTLNQFFFKAMPFDSQKDLAPLTTAVRGVLGVAVNPGIGVNSIAELVAWGKKNPGKLSFGTSGTGSPQHLMGALIGQAGGVDIVHVPYQGGAPAITDTLAGHIPMNISTMSAILPHAKTGGLKIIAVGDKQRFVGAPEIPTVAETYPEIEASSWLGFFAPAGTPQPIVERLSNELRKALTSPDVKATLDGVGLMVVADAPEDLAKLVKYDIDRFRVVVEKMGVKPE